MGWFGVVGWTGCFHCWLEQVIFYLHVHVERVNVYSSFFGIVSTAPKFAAY